MAIDFEGAARDLDQFGQKIRGFFDHPDVSLAFRLFCRNPHMASSLVVWMRSRPDCRDVDQPMA